MNLLSYIVPAIREIRAPLVGGYLWLLAAWLNLGDRVPDSSDADPGAVWYQLTRLNDAVGTAGIAVAASVAALLVGSLIGEGIAFVMSRRWESPDVLRLIGTSVPEAQFAADRATATYAEGELRLHVALPLAVVAVSLMADDLALGIVLAVFAILLGWHGTLLLRRWVAQAAAVRRLVDQQTSTLSDEERRERGADLRFTISGDGMDMRIHVGNSGRATARDVDIKALDGSVPSFIMDGFLPIDELRTGESVAIPAALSLADLPVQAVDVQWIDETGEHSEMRTLRFS